MRVTLAQIAPKLSKINLEYHLDLIKDYKFESDVIVFPELSLSGYLLLDKVYEDAFTLEELTPLVEASKECDIIVGVALKSKKHIYNAALYFSRGMLVHLHKKNHLPTYGMFEESRYFSKGNTIEAFETSFGTSVVVVCEDIWRASTIERLSQLDVEYIYVIAASPTRGFENNGLTIQKQWEALCQTTALLTNAKLIFVNRVGFEDGLGFWGGSMIVSHEGKIEAQLSNFEAQNATFDLTKNSFKAKQFIVKHH